MTSTLKLKALMLKQGFTQEDVAMRLGISAQSLNAKINNKREFKASEIQALMKILGIPLQETYEIFFAHDVDF